MSLIYATQDFNIVGDASAIKVLIKCGFDYVSATHIDTSVLSPSETFSLILLSN